MGEQLQNLHLHGCAVCSDGREQQEMPAKAPALRYLAASSFPTAAKVVHIAVPVGFQPHLRMSQQHYY
jgi:hypothetical protein